MLALLLLALILIPAVWIGAWILHPVHPGEWYYVPLVVTVFFGEAFVWFFVSFGIWYLIKNKWPKFYDFFK